MGVRRGRRRGDDGRPAVRDGDGCPARRAGWVSEAGHTLQFDGDRAVCPETRQVYVQRSADRIERVE